MATRRSLDGMRESLESLSVFVALDSLYTKSERSPLARSKPASEKYRALGQRLEDVLRNKLCIKSAGNTRDLPFSTIFSLAEMVIYSSATVDEICVEVMSPIYPGDFLTYHSLNVAFLASRVGSTLHLSFEQLTQLCVAALLHDIGMTKIDPDSYMREGALTQADRNAIEDHPNLGKRFFERIAGEFPWLIRVINEEHRREHGQGYPNEDFGELHTYSKIVGVCDFFEALTHQRPNRAAYHPADVMKKIIDTKDRLFTKDILRAMIEALALYPVGSLVQLNNNMMAQVVDAVQGSPLRPVVRLLDKETKAPSAQPIDLSTDNNVYITGLVYADPYQVPEDLHIT